MSRVKPFAREAGDDGRDAGQGPEIRREAMRGGASEQGPLDPRQGRAVQARLAARPAGPFEPLPTSGLPHVKPSMRRGDADAQCAGDCVLRQTLAKQLGRLESPRFQRGDSLGPAAPSAARGVSRQLVCCWDTRESPAGRPGVYGGGQGSKSHRAHDDGGHQLLVTQTHSVWRENTSRAAPVDDLQSGIASRAESAGDCGPRRIRFARRPRRRGCSRRNAAQRPSNQSVAVRVQVGTRLARVRASTLFTYCCRPTTIRRRDTPVWITPANPARVCGISPIWTGLLRPLLPMAASRWGTRHRARRYGYPAGIPRDIPVHFERGHPDIVVRPRTCGPPG